MKFEADNIYTLDSNGRMILTILASVAEEESHSKSIIMNWSIDRRFSRGLFLTPALLGYDQDEDGNLVVNEKEAQTVKVIYYLYLNGFSFTEIAELLTEYGRKTKLGNTEWNPGTIAGIIANERHCGDAGAHRVTRLNETNSCEIKCVAFSRMIYRDAHWNMKRSYRLAGRSFPEQSLVSFSITGAIPIENGKMLDAAVSPTVAPRWEEVSPSQNNPSSAVKADSEAV